ncbi:MAG: hypothetical protein H6644_05400 [Caldilineaceae bacterium]|nr:hypothetical protein [Caldilineaceae bacterium]
MQRRNVLPLLLVLTLTGCTSVQIPLPPADAPAAATAPAPQEPAAESAAVQPPDDLFAAFAEPSQTTGDVLILYGQVLDVAGAPVPDAAVEIWQTDAAGVYDHPRDPGTNSRDTSFQFYGAATTDAAGWYAFRTIVPGEYEPRPRHIHFKVKQDDETLLTSQFYFSDDVAQVEGEGMFRAAGDSGDLLLLQLVQGDGVLLANGQIVVDTGIGAGTLPLTPAQGEGPYYPVVTVAEYDNDLTRLP